VHLKHLEFKEKYLEKLLSSEKTITIRRRAYVKPNDVVFVHCGGKIIGKAKIKDVRKIKREELNEEIAKKDGFDSFEDFIKEINDYYSDQELYLIEFELEPFENPLDPREMYYGEEDLIEIAKKALNSEKLSEREKEILKLFIRTGSIRKTARKIGGLKNRGIVREVLRKAYKIAFDNQK